jgi:PrgI family protein
MRFEVPQFIEIEDKIFGPLTWRQFLYLGGGVGMAVVMFFTLPFLLFVILGLPLALLAAALSFYPVNNRPFSFFLEAIVNYVVGQRLYLWRQKADIVHKTSNRSRLKTASEPDINKGKKDITSLARKLELQALQKTE